MTYEEYRKEMKKLGWNDDDIDRYIELFEKLIHMYPIYKKELKLEHFLKKPPESPKSPVVYTSGFSNETMEKYWKQSEED